MRPFLVAGLAVLCLAACAPKPAANTAQVAGAGGPSDCAASGFAPGSAGYQSCVNALATTNSATASGDAAQMRAQIQQQMQQQQSQGSAAGCTTTRDANNNVTTQCP